jgi:hypothetical protein
VVLRREFEFAGAEEEDAEGGGAGLMGGVPGGNEGEREWGRRRGVWGRKYGEGFCGERGVGKQAREGMWGEVLGCGWGTRADGAVEGERMS